MQSNIQGTDTRAADSDPTHMPRPEDRVAQNACILPPGQHRLPTGGAVVDEDESTVDRSSAAACPKPVNGERAVYGTKWILIADDDSAVRRSLAAVLESEGYIVDEACNGVEAVRLALEHAPDLVLLDVSMPHWDGWTAFGMLDHATPSLPVVVITARPDQYQKAVQLGVDAFMEKPLDIEVLIRAIKRLTSNNEQHRSRRIANPPFVTELLGSTAS